MKTKRIIITILAVLLVAGIASAESAGMETAIQKGIECHNLARTGASGMAEECCRLLEPYVAVNPVAAAYYGSAQTIMASSVASQNPIKALDYLQTGSEFLDQAVELAPDDWFVHLIRLENGIEVSRSSPLRRYKAIRPDVEWFLEDEHILELEGESMAEAYLYCACFKLDEGDLDYALELLECSIDAAPASVPAQKAEALLDRYTE